MFRSQLKGFLKRNYLLRFRNKPQLAWEVLAIVFLIVTLVLFSYFFRAQQLPSAEFNPINVPSEFRLNVLISPNNTDTISIGDLMTQNRNNITLTYFSGHVDMQNYYRSKRNENGIWFGVEFNDLENLTHYKMHVPWDDALFDEDASVRLFADSMKCRNVSNNNPYQFQFCAGNMFAYNGFSYFHTILNFAIIKHQIKDPLLKIPQFQIQNMPKQQFVQENIILTSTTAFFFSLIFINSTITFITNLVSEKDKKLKLIMQSMGMYNSAFWLSWIIIYLIEFTLINLILMIVIISTEIIPSFQLGMVVFMLLEIYSLVNILFGMMFSTAFTKSKSAGAAYGSFYAFASIMFFIILVPRQFDIEFPKLIQYIIAFLYPCGFSLGIDQILYIQAKYDNKFDWKFILDEVRPNTLTILESLVVLVIDGLLFLLLTLYFDHVLPNGSGNTKPLFFFLSPSFWSDKRKRYRKRHKTGGDVEAEPDLSLHSIPGSDNPDIEPVDDSLINKGGIVIEKLVKQFKNEEGKANIVINNLNLSVYRSQITVIVGHNAVGKTSLLKTIIGLLKPDSGSIRYRDYNASSSFDMTRIQKMCGYCPQHDALDDLLDSVDHLRFYAMLKGMSYDRYHPRIDDLLISLDLHKCRHVLAKNLTSGQKRKLCVAIALIGDPPMVLLDEATSGMDPSNRHLVWSLLENEKKNRVIILTTHFMDEADILGDRIVFMINGSARYIGSSEFLKSKLSNEYLLNIIGKTQFEERPDKLTRFVEKYVPSAQLVSCVVKEATYTLSKDDVKNYGDLFYELEKHGKSFGIQDVGVSRTSLDKTFLKLGQRDPESTLDLLNTREFNRQRTDTVLGPDSYKIRSDFWKFLSLPLYYLMKIRFLLAFRSKITFILRFVSPIPFVILTVLLPKLVRPTAYYDPDKLPLINLQIDDYATRERPFVIINSIPGIDQEIGKIVANNHYPEQPFLRLNDTRQLIDENDSPLPSYSGVLYQDWISTWDNQVVLLYNDSALLSLPYLVHVWSNYFMKASGKTLLNATICAWPKSVQNSGLIDAFDFSSFTFLILLGCGLLFPLSSFASEMVHDREIKCYNQLRLNGCSFLSYWTSAIFCFLIQYMAMPLILFTLIFSIPYLNITGYTPAGAKVAVIISTFIYMPCNLVVSLCISFMFNRRETATSVLTALLMLLFIVPYLLVNLLQFKSRDLSNICHLIFCLLDPIYGFVGTYNRISEIYFYEQIENAYKFEQSKDVPFELYFEFEHYFLPLSMIFGTINLVLYSILLFVIEHRMIDLKICSSGDIQGTEKENNDLIANEDDDVGKERARIRDRSLNAATLIIKNVRKEYKRKRGTTEWLNGQIARKNSNFDAIDSRPQRKKDIVAVRNLTLGISPGETFGLTGPNGAGKTTTINMATGQLESDAGVVKIGKRLVNSSTLPRLHDLLALCPQYNPCWDDLTLREHLIMYSCVRKMPEDEIKRACHELIRALDLAEQADKKVKHLSGGTKRKLSLAMAMIGSPKYLFLDEPSTGLDPSSKRYIWNAILNYRDRKDNAIILTSHSVDEVQVLCTRIGIMNKGELRRLGTWSYLRNKSRTGYTLEVRAYNKSSVTRLNMLIDQIFNHKARQIQHFSNHYKFELPKESIKSFGFLFEKLEKARDDQIISDYSLYQFSLEDEIIKSSREQES